MRKEDTMPGNPSFYFTLFKKFQVLNHVPGGIVHGDAAAPTSDFNLTDPKAGNSVVGTSRRGKRKKKTIL